MKNNLESNEKKLPSEQYLHMNFYDESARTASVPNCSEYEFLLERNKNHMNDVAITFAGKKITYEELHTRIDEYAKALYKKGIRSKDVVAMGIANTPEGIYISYALNKLGAVTSPINFTYNAYQMRRDLEIINPKMYIGIKDSYKVFKNASKGMDIEKLNYSVVQSIDDKKLHFLYNVKQIISGNYSFNPNESLNYVLHKGKNYSKAVFPKYTPGELSDIMFTGGSSGVHKGVDLTGNGLNSVIRGLDFVLCLEPGQKFLGNLPQFMAFGKMALHYALCNNLNLELTLKALPQDFVDELLRVHPDGVMGGPVQWETLINNPKLTANSLNNLVMPITGGEQLKFGKEGKINEALEKAGCKSTIWNGLGMSEMWAPVSVKRGNINSNETIGTMIPFTNAKVVNPTTGEELGFNEDGMLHVSGPGMMIGYHNNPEETNNTTYVDEKGVRWFKTGDICKIQENGELQYVGRLKRCFVCGCENIYPEEIENLLCSIPEIREAIVTKIPNDEKQFLPKYHISLYNVQPNLDVLKSKIEKLIKSTLGEGPLPCDYEFYYEMLPRTANGKIDPKPFQEKDLEEYKQKTKHI